jgi:hypothetical protein
LGGPHASESRGSFLEGVADFGDEGFDLVEECNDFLLGGFEPGAGCEGVFEGGVGSGFGVLQGLACFFETDQGIAGEEGIGWPLAPAGGAVEGSGEFGGGDLDAVDDFKDRVFR